MRTSFLDRKLQQTKKAESKFEDLCGVLAGELQQYFKHEISVCAQPGDGLVVVWEGDDTCAPHNIAVEHAILNIKKDKDAYTDW